MIRVLLIEDNPADARLVREYLYDGVDAADFRLEEAGSLAEAIEFLEANRFDVVLTDLNLPDARHAESFQKISSIWASLPVVILSGYEDDEAAAAMVAEGAQDYLNKSDLSGKMIRKAIRYAIERKLNDDRLRSVSADLQKKNEELQKAQRQLIHAEKMETVGHLASGIAHEVKNPLAVIQLGLDNLLALSARSPGVFPGKTLERMQTSLDRADGIIRELLEFSSDTEFDLFASQLSHPAGNAIRLLEPQWERAEIQLSFDKGEDPLVEMNPNKIEQVLVNLLLNAIHSLETHQGEKKIKICIRQTETVESARTELLVEDSGPGVEDENLATIFDPFYTTKGPNEGTGLGLTVVSQIVELHQGSIFASRSTELGGLCVTIALPNTKSQGDSLSMPAGEA